MAMVASFDEVEEVAVRKMWRRRKKIKLLSAATLIVESCIEDGRLAGEMPIYGRFWCIVVAC